MALVPFAGLGSWFSCGLYVVLGVGLLKLQPWARVMTVADVIVNLGLLGVAALNGLLNTRLLFLVAYLLRLPIYVVTVWYLLEPKVSLAFRRRKDSITAFQFGERP